MSRRKKCACGYEPKGAPMRKHDAYWCPDCDVWLEEGCRARERGAGYCEFCTNRPEKPSQVDDKRSWGE